MHVQGVADRKLRSLEDLDGLAGEERRQRCHHACSWVDVGVGIPDARPETLRYADGMAKPPFTANRLPRQQAHVAVG